MIQRLIFLVMVPGRGFIDGGKASRVLIPRGIEGLKLLIMMVSFQIDSLV